MLQKLIHHVTSSGGVFNYFNQTLLIRKNQWLGTNYKNLSGAWFGDTGHKNADGEVFYGLYGVCYGLSGAYLIKGGQWSEFEPYINSRAGHSIILGVMNCQAQRTALVRAVKNSKALKSRFKQGIPSAKESFDIIMKSAGVNYYSSQALPIINNAELRMKMLVDQLKPGYGYEISFYSSTSGHSVAAWVEKNVIKFFDCNYGEITFPNTMAGQAGLKVALGILVSNEYNEHSRVVIESYRCRAMAR